LIIAFAAEQMIVASIAVQYIVAANSAGLTIGDLITVDNIITITTVKFVAPDAADDLIVAIIAEHPIIAVACAGVIREDEIITSSTVEVVVAGAANDCVVPVTGIYKVVTVPSNDGVVPVSPDQHIVVICARDDIECVQMEPSNV
jgi:hypothetical protein